MKKEDCLKLIEMGKEVHSLLAKGFGVVICAGKNEGHEIYSSATVHVPNKKGKERPQTSLVYGVSCSLSESRELATMTAFIDAIESIKIRKAKGENLPNKWVFLFNRDYEDEKLVELALEDFADEGMELYCSDIKSIGIEGCEEYFFCATDDMKDIASNIACDAFAEILEDAKEYEFEYSKMKFKGHLISLPSDMLVMTIRDTTAKDMYEYTAVVQDGASLYVIDNLGDSVHITFLTGASDEAVKRAKETFLC